MGIEYLQPDVGPFVPARLQAARLARTLKQNELAEAVDVSPASLCKWEGEDYTHQPDQPTIGKLSDKLAVAPAWFFKPMAADTSPPFFRSLKKEQKAVRDRAQARLAFVESIYSAVNDYVEFPEVDIPDFLKGLSFSEIRQEQVERIALDMREYWSLGDDPIDDLMVVIENAGVVVAEDSVGSASLDGLSRWSADDVPLILLARDKRSTSRRRFDAAHEFAHLILHRSVSKEQFIAAFDLIEEQAMSLASAFLMPASTFSADIDNPALDSLADKKPKWKVSVAAMIKRLGSLNMISDQYQRNLWKYYSARQWRAGEPHEDSIDFERPLNLKGAFEMIAEKSDELENVISETALLPKDISELTGVEPSLLSQRVVERPRLKLVPRGSAPKAAND